MKQLLFLIFFCISSLSIAQNVQVDSQTYSPQQLIETILIGSNCISNVVVTNVSGGDFGGNDQSYGYFTRNGSTFPFQNGIVLSSGRLSNVAGPNTSISQDDAPNWFGDADLERILNQGNTNNATIIEFEFTALASQISFRYLFASEEYLIDKALACIYSDLFGFLIRNVNDTHFENIALIPNTQIPVKVTSVHPDIPNGCPAQNETYFGSWNDNTAPINFNGQTAILKATANTIPNETYHVKLVIADQQDALYDSAVFLEAGSFQLNTDLGADRLISTNNPLCENETLQLDASQPNATSYKWFKNRTEEMNETGNTYNVMDPGRYSVEVTLQNNCVSYGEITIDYSRNPIIRNTTLIACDENQDGLTTYNLYDTEEAITNNNKDLTIFNFYRSPIEAQQTINEITNPESFNSTTPQQIIYARIENQYGCFAIAELTLDISNKKITIPAFEVCDTDNDGYTSFNLDALKSSIQPNIPVNTSISFYKNLTDFFNETNQLNGTYNNKIQNSETLYVKIKNGIDCFALSTVELKTSVTPQLIDDETTIYCLNTFPNTKTISAGLLNNTGNNPMYQWFLNSVLLPDTTESIQINKTGIYTVLVTFSNTCTASRTINVIPSSTATIQSINISQGTSNNIVTVNVLGEGNYQFSLDAFMYQTENTFTNVTAGFHTVYVFDINGCGTVEKQIAILGFPKYFTPNNDGFNDFWKPFGVNAQFNNDVDIKIFNRYGKLIKQINPAEVGWNGSFKGELMPNDDYWYIVIAADGTIFRGHFTLKR